MLFNAYVSDFKEEKGEELTLDDEHVANILVVKRKTFSVHAVGALLERPV